MVSTELLTALGIEENVHVLTLEGLPVGKLAVKDVEHYLANL